VSQVRLVGTLTTANGQEVPVVITGELTNQQLLHVPEFPDFKGSFDPLSDPLDDPFPEERR